jgi:hypothetical protein
LHSLPDVTELIKSRKIRGVGYVAYMADKRISYKIFIRQTEGKRALER